MSEKAPQAYQHPEEEQAAKIRSAALIKDSKGYFSTYNDPLGEVLAENQELRKQLDEVLGKKERLQKEQEHIARKLKIDAEKIATLEKLAAHDALTALLNRRGFEDMFQNMREQELGRGSLVFLDVDKFKEINDQYGHVIGDQALKKIADTLKMRLRPTDLVGRYAGDEFILFLPGASPQDVQNRFMVEGQPKIIVPLSFKHDGVDKNIEITLSGGIVEFQDNDDLEQAKQKSDKLLYEVKEAGRGFLKIEKDQDEPDQLEPPVEFQV